MRNNSRFVVVQYLRPFDGLNGKYTIIAQTGSIAYINTIAGALKRLSKTSTIYWADTKGVHGIWSVYLNGTTKTDEIQINDTYTANEILGFLKKEKLM